MVFPPSEWWLGGGVLLSQGPRRAGCWGVSSVMQRLPRPRHCLISDWKPALHPLVWEKCGQNMSCPRCGPGSPWPRGQDRRSLELSLR